MKQTLMSLALAIGTSLSAWAGPSILDLKHSITDNNIIAPESFETQTRLLEENFYLKNFVVPGIDTGASPETSPATYQERLTRLPTVIELPYNSIVGNFIDMYVGRKRGLVADMVALHNYYGRFFEEELLRQGMPVELEYLPVIESAINPNAVSRAGAVGLWQFMPATAKGLGMEVNSLVDERRDPRISSRNAARYLKQLHDIYDDWSLAIAAYNCGPGNVNKALRRAGGENGVKKDFWEIYPYLPAETRGYVPAFIAANYVMNYYRDHGITPTVVKRQLTTDTVTVNKYVHFNQIAAVLDIPVEEIRMLNPQFLKDIIPGDYRPYQLTLPTQQCLSYVMSEKKILDYDRDLYARRTTAEPAGMGGEESGSMYVSDGGSANLAMAARQSVNADANNALASTRSGEETVRLTHIVSQGDNLREIARRYGVSATDIKRLNQLRGGKIQPGQELVIETVGRLAPDEAEVEKSETLTALASKPVPAAAAAAEPERATVRGEEKARQNTSRTTQPKTTTHKVRKGDTLGALAARYHTTVAAIQGVNGMKKNNTSIRVGQVLKIPAKGSTTKAPAKKKSSRRRR